MVVTEEDLGHICNKFRYNIWLYLKITIQFISEQIG